MRKILTILLVVLGLFITALSYAAPLTTETYVTPEDASIAKLERNRQLITDYINSFPGGNIQTATVTSAKLDANANPENRWNEAFNDFVYTGLLPPTTTSTLTSTTIAGTAYVDGVRVVKDATAHAYTASKYTYVDLSSTGTYTYSETAIGAAEPSTTANSIRLCRVSTDPTQIAAVRDDRVTSVQLAQNEDFYRSGLTISVTTPDTISIAPGVCYHGTTRVSKTAATSLVLGTATDWVDGVSGRAVSTMGFVVTDSGGNIKLTTTAPTKADTSGNTAGKLRYSVVSSVYYRILAWFYMNATGSGNITSSSLPPNQDGYGNFKDGDVSNIIKIVGNTDITTTSTGYVGMNNMTAEYLTVGQPVKISFQAPIGNSTAYNDVNIVIDIDGTDKIETQTIPAENGECESTSLFWLETLSAGTHTIKIQWKTDAGTAKQEGSTVGARILIIEEQ